MLLNGNVLEIFLLALFFLACIFLENAELDVLCLARASCFVVLPVTVNPVVSYLSNQLVNTVSS